MEDTVVEFKRDRRGGHLVGDVVAMEEAVAVEDVTCAMRQCIDAHPEHTTIPRPAGATRREQQIKKTQLRGSIIGMCAAAADETSHCGARVQHSLESAKGQATWQIVTGKMWRV